MNSQTKNLLDTLAQKHNELKDPIYTRCVCYNNGKCKLGNNLNCDHACQSLDLGETQIYFVLFKCKSCYKFTLGFLLGVRGSKPFLKPQESFNHSCPECKMSYSIKEIRHIKKARDIIRFCDHTVKHWKLPLSFAGAIMNHYLFYCLIVIPECRNRGMNSVKINAFLTINGEIIRSAYNVFKQSNTNSISDFIEEVEMESFLQGIS